MNSKRSILVVLFTTISILFYSFTTDQSESYTKDYKFAIGQFVQSQSQLIENIKANPLKSTTDIDAAKNQLAEARLQLKAVDFWLRYLEPLAYKKINSPLPVEWETEVFEKFEKPYKREGAGFTLATLYFDEPQINKDTLLHLLSQSHLATQIFLQDSILQKMKSHDHFYLANRLFLLNLAAIYTTGFECPDTVQVLTELQFMLKGVDKIYSSFNNAFTQHALSPAYLKLYDQMKQFVIQQSRNYSQFDHFKFIKDYVNPLFVLNQQLILLNQVSSRSNLDYSLSKSAKSIFDKNLYMGQNTKGIYLRVKDEKALALINDLGKSLFYDPILSGNNQRSCASCHSSSQFFTDTTQRTSLQFDKALGNLARNTPSLLNAQFNHLLMLDGKHYTMQHQGVAVITNQIEMNCAEKVVLEKVLSCKEYKFGFEKLLKYTPQEKTISMEHLVSALTFFYGKFSQAQAPFDKAMNKEYALDADEVKGFNLFMSKAQCATCHFVPQFNGVKPPFIGSEFEVLGTPANKKYTSLSADLGRAVVFEAAETKNAFRTGSLRNIAKTKPYMHNGVFDNLEEVMEFYNGGGGAGRGLTVPNQTLSSDSLKLTELEKKQVIKFMHALTEDVPFEQLPVSLPKSNIAELNKRVVGGVY